MLKSILTCSLILCGTALADVHQTVNGFVGLTYQAGSVKLQDNTVAPNIGLIHTLELDEHWSTLLQLNYTGDETIENLATFAFVRFSSSVETVPYEVEIGKFRLEHGLYGGQLTNPSTSPQLLPANSIYFNELKYNLFSAYGIKNNWYFGNFELSASVGMPVTNEPHAEFSSWFNIPYNDPNIPNEYRNLNPQFGGVSHFFLKHTTESNTFKIDYGRIRLNTLIGGNLITIGDEFRYKGWSFSAEALLVNPTHFDRGVITYDTIFNFDSSISNGQSATIAYDFGDTKVYTNFNRYNSKQHLPSTVHNKFKAFYNDFNVGVTHSLSDHWLLRAEYHWIEGDRMLSDMPSYTNPSYDHYQLGIVGITYFF